MNTVNMENDQWQLGKTKVFVKNPESVSISSQGTHSYFSQIHKNEAKI